MLNTAVRRAPRRIALALLLTAVATSCARPLGSGGDVASGTATVRIENRAFLDVNVYASRSGQRIRLGTVTGNTTQVLPVPKSFVGTGVPVRFQADFIGSNKAPVSEEIVIWEGDEVQLTIPAT